MTNNLKGIDFDSDFGQGVLDGYIALITGRYGDNTQDVIHEILNAIYRYHRQKDFLLGKVSALLENSNRKKGEKHE